MDSSPQSRFGWPARAPVLVGVLLLEIIYLAGLQRYYLFDGDHAVQIIMAKYFAGESRDFFFWGQSRLGSLIPVILILPVKVLRLPGLASGVTVSLAFYLAWVALLVLNARGPVERSLVLGALCLVPVGAYRFLLYTGHPYAPSMSLMMGAFTLCFAPTTDGRTKPVSGGRCLLAGLLLGVAFWVSEATLAGISALGWLLWRRRRALELDVAKVGSLGLGLVALVPLTIAWRQQIGDGEALADHTRLASIEQIGVGLQRFFPQLSDLVASQPPTKPVVAWAVAILLVLVNLAALFRRRLRLERGEESGTPIVGLLAIQNLVHFAIVLCARHSYFGEGQIQRYWVPVVVSSLFLMVVLARRAAGGWRSRAGVVRCAAIVCFACLLRLDAARFPGADRDWHRRIDAHWASLARLREQRVTRAIGDYWDALPLTVLSEFEILAVPEGFGRMESLRGEFWPAEGKPKPFRL